MITPFRKKAISSRSTRHPKRFQLRLFVAVALMLTCSGCQWMYTDMSDPPATKKTFAMDENRPKAARNTFNMSGLSDESQAIERNLGGH
jgi:hypothetical protein